MERPAGLDIEWGGQERDPEGLWPGTHCFSEKISRSGFSQAMTREPVRIRIGMFENRENYGLKLTVASISDIYSSFI
jgi:hypothetical protein